MPSVKNETKLAQIKEDLEGAGAVWVVDACGLTVKETQALRQAVRCMVLAHSYLPVMMLLLPLRRLRSSPRPMRPWKSRVV